MKRFCLLFGLTLLTAFLAFAALSGTWVVANPPQGAPHTLVLGVAGANLTGTIDGIAITNGKSEGQSLWFNATRNGVAYSYKGSYYGGTMQLTETHTDGSQLRNYTLNQN